MKFAKASTALLVVILAISFFIIFSLYTNLAPETSDRSMNKWIDVLLTWSCILLAISCLAITGLEIAHALSDKIMTRKYIIFIGALGVVFLISFLFSDSELPQFNGVEIFIANGTLTPTISRCIEACLFTSYVLITVAIIGVIYSYFYRLFN